MAEFGALQFASGIAGAAGKAAAALFQLSKDVKKDRKSAVAFAREVEALAGACGAAEGLIRDHHSDSKAGRSSNRELERCWRVLERAVESCRSTVLDLEDAMSWNPLTSNEQPSIFARVVRQIQLNLKTKELEEVRDRIQSHTTSLQLAFDVLQV